MSAMIEPDGGSRQRWAHAGVVTCPHLRYVLSGVAVTVVLGEDSFLAREGIVRALEAVAEVDLLASCDDLPTLRTAIETHDPDVVLTDIRMPPHNTDEGIRLAAELRSTSPATGVVVISQHADPIYAMTLFEDGTARRGYLLKESVREPAELGRALREVAQGGSVVDPRIVDRLLRTHQERDDSELATLTPREREILALIAEGRSNKSIADSLVITKRAVEGHINAIFGKLDLGEPEDVSLRVKAALVYLTGQV
jgi:DNA-binding NarL/FixJ family response regulator